MGASLIISKGSRNNGAIVVKKNAPLALGALTNVKVDTPNDGDVLVYDQPTQTWIAAPTIDLIDGGFF